MSDDAEILHPERVINIGGMDVTVSEFSFRDSLDLGPALSSMLVDLDDAVGDGSNMSGMFDAFYAHPAALELVLLKCTGMDKSFLDGLSSEDGDTLIMAMFDVNGAFFLRRLAARRMLDAAGRNLEKST